MGSTGEYLARVADIADVVRSEAAEADRNRRLGDKTVRAMVDAGLHRMGVPPALGGGGLTWAELWPVYEAMARVDGAAGWNLSIWAAGTLALTLHDDAARDAVLADDALISASLNFMNIKAERVEGGYTFDGKATFLSGSSHARWVSLGGWLHENGKPTFANGAPHVIRGIAPMASLPLEDTWHVGGLRATASNDAALERLFVPHGFISDPGRYGALVPDDAVHIPLQSRFGSPFAWVAIGIARGALDAFAEVAGSRVALATTAPMRERADVQIDVSRAHALIESGEAFLERTWEDAIAKVVRGERLCPEDLARLRLSYVTAAEHAAQATELVRRVAGSAGLYEADRIERCWRDAHAVQVHVMVSPRNHERTGRVLLGLDPLPGIL